MGVAESKDNVATPLEQPTSMPSASDANAQHHQCPAQDVSSHPLSDQTTYPSTDSSESKILDLANSIRTTVGLDSMPPPPAPPCERLVLARRRFLHRIMPENPFDVNRARYLLIRSRVRTDGRLRGDKRSLNPPRPRSVSPLSPYCLPITTPELRRQQRQRVGSPKRELEQSNAYLKFALCNQTNARMDAQGKRRPLEEEICRIEDERRHHGLDENTPGDWESEFTDPDSDEEESRRGGGVEEKQLNHESYADEDHDDGASNASGVEYSRRDARSRCGFRYEEDGCNQVDDYDYWGDDSNSDSDSENESGSDEEFGEENPYGGLGRVRSHESSGDERDEDADDGAEPLSEDILLQLAFHLDDYLIKHASAASLGLAGNSPYLDQDEMAIDHTEPEVSEADADEPPISTSGRVSF